MRSAGCPVSGVKTDRVCCVPMRKSDPGSAVHERLECALSTPLLSEYKALGTRSQGAHLVVVVLEVVADELIQHKVLVG